MKNAIAIVALAGFAAGATADIRITEWMYNPGPWEYVEFTNLGNSPVDMAGWSYDDDNRRVGQFDLSGFGVVMPGESVVITETTPADFRAQWSLPASIKVIGPFTNNLGRNDEINLYDAGGNLVDRLTFGDQAFPGSIRTQNRAGVPLTLGAVGANDVFQWGFADSVPGGGPFDLTSIYGGQGFFVSANGFTGSPGYFIPAPAAAGLLGFAGLLGARRRR